MPACEVGLPRHLHPGHDCVGNANSAMVGGGHRVVVVVTVVVVMTVAMIVVMIMTKTKNNDYDTWQQHAVRI